jgi:hypothetical protein
MDRGQSCCLWDNVGAYLGHSSWEHETNTPSEMPESKGHEPNWGQPKDKVGGRRNPKVPGLNPRRQTSKFLLDHRTNRTGC